MVDERDGGLAAHVQPLLLRRRQNPLGSPDDTGLNILKHLQEPGLHFRLDIVDLFDELFVHRLAGAFAEADALSQHHGLPPVGHQRGDCIVVEHLDCLHGSTPV